MIENKAPGWWIEHEHDDEFNWWLEYECTECGGTSCHDSAFCPNCGASMQGTKYPDESTTEIKTCAVCGAPYVDAYCPNCGSREVEA